MKKLQLTLLALSFSVIAFAQQPEPNTLKEHKNIIGIDANGILSQIFNFSPYNSVYYSPYMLRYKRLLNQSNTIRFNIGGYANSREYTTNDTLPSSDNYTDVNLGLGYAHYCYLGKHWNYYFGIDAIFQYSKSEYKSTYSPNGKREQTNKTKGYGASPFFGIQFLINPRMSISTETSYAIIHTESRVTNAITDNQYYYSYLNKGSGTQTTFYLPTSIVFRVTF